MDNLKCFLILLCVFCMACNPKYYSPNTANIPLLRTQGQINASVMGDANQFGVLAAYGLTDKVGLMLNGGVFRPRDLDNGNGGSGTFFEAGPGFLAPINDEFTFEIYGLLGYGNLENHLPSTVLANPMTTGDLSAKAAKFTLQPNIGYRNSSFELGFTTRIAGLQYFDIKGDLIFENEAQTDYLKDNKFNFLIEPALVARVGTDVIQFQAQVGHSINTSNSTFRQEKWLLNIGANFTFGGESY